MAVALPLDPSMKDGPALHITITTNFIKNYTGQDDDVASQMTDVTDVSRYNL